MDIYRLNQEELSYELRLRGLPTGKVDEMRVSLREALKVEKDGRSLILKPYPFTFESDSELLNRKVEEVGELLKTFSGDGNSGDYKKIYAKIEWALRRLDNLNPEGDEQKGEKAKIRANLFLSLGSLKIKADGGYDDDDSSDETADLSTTAAVINKAYSRVDIHKWDIKFSGDQGQSGQSLNSFLERVDELAEARGISKYQLFHSALDLFSGKALIWYRANKSKFHSWNDLTKGLKREFLPYDYDDRLIDEIKKRTQGKDESIGMYIAVMTTMFNRLSEPLTEGQKLRILKRNISPFYQTQLGLTEVDTVTELIELGRRLESIRISVESYAPPPSKRSTHLLEPDLAYVAAERSVVAVVDNQTSNVDPGRQSRMKCFRCGRHGHIARVCQSRERVIRCYGCGTVGVIRPECRNCSNRTNSQPQQDTPSTRRNQNRPSEQPQPQTLRNQSSQAPGNASGARM